MEYIALLRGINVGGKNPVPMAALRETFEKSGCNNVSTYINSGNVLFDTPLSDPDQASNPAFLTRHFERRLEARFGFAIGVVVLESKALRAALDKAPPWWGVNDGGKHNAIFPIPPTPAAEILTVIGEVKPEYERVAVIEPVIFWSAPKETFEKSRYSTIVQGPAYRRITIRNANTVRKLAQLSVAPA